MTTQVVLNVNSNSAYAQHNGKSFSVLKEYANGKCVDINLNGIDTQMSISEVIFDSGITKQPKLTPAQNKVYDCLAAGNEIILHGSYGFKYTSSNGVDFSYKTIEKMLDLDILKVKVERTSGIAKTCRTIVIA